MKPMLAGKFVESKQVYPCYVQPKLDGIRCLVIDGKPFSRTLKPIPNTFVQQWFENFGDYLNGLDGELIVGEPTAPDVYRKTMSGIMSQGGEPDFKYHVFDMLEETQTCEVRMNALLLRMQRIMESEWEHLKKRIAMVLTLPACCHEEILEQESIFLAAGYEGAIIRSVFGRYKSGKRPSATTGELLKLKRFLDDEATIIGFEELYSNQNEATIDALGHTKRSSHQANKVPQGTLGALTVRNSRGHVFNIGTGFDQATRKEIWGNASYYLNKTVTYRYVEVGGYDVPRFPVFHGFRDPST